MIRRQNLISIFLGLLLAPAATLAQGTLIPRDFRPEIMPRHGYVFSIKSQRADVDIRRQVATTTVEQVFVNNTNRDLEGWYLFPIPKDASISKFTMWMNGEEVEGEVVEATRARGIYEQIVRQMRDPGLLEFVGKGLFRARVYPIPARGDVQVKMSYEEVLPYDAGLVTYTLPFKTDCNRFGRIGEVSVAVDIESDVPIKNLYSPTHDIDARVRGRRASCGFELSNAFPSEDFLLYYAVSEDDVGLSLLTHRSRGDDGYFMMLVSPGDLDDHRKVIAKDIVFVLDKSGSMKGEKIEQARAALSYCVKSLNENDRFNIIAFSTNVDRFAGRLLEATRRNRNEALDFIDGIKARGGTDINQALAEALDLPRSDNPQMVVFLTDGLPTVGETGVAQILDNLKKHNKTRARIFPFGVGYDVNTELLDRMSIDHRATVEYIKPEEDIEVKVSRFYDKVSSPVLSDVKLDLGRIDIHDTYPMDMPDIFNGTQLVVLGRYSDDGATTIELSGRVGGKRTTFTYEGNFEKSTRANSFIPRLWANRKIAYLLSEIKLNGAEKELIDEVIELSLEHGIITPYTSYLVLEEGTDADRLRLSRAVPPAAGAGPHVRGGRDGEVSFEKMSVLHETPAEVNPASRASGKAATGVSRDIAELKEQSVLKSDESGLTRYVGEKRFVLRGDEWVDADFDEKMKVEEIEFLSEKYFRFLEQHPEVKDYLALGEKVTFVFNNKAYRITQ